MYITALEPFKKGSKKIYSDNGYLFWLYDSEIRKYNIEEAAEISDEIISEITNTIVFLRARQKVIRLLEKMDRTEQELMRKLHENGYTDDIAYAAVTYAKSYGYVDDTRYVSMYLRLNCKKKSRRVLMSTLLQKGISKDIIEDAFVDLSEEAEYCMNTEENALEREISKRLKGKSISDFDTAALQKIMAALFRKGYPYELIKKKFNYDDL